MLHRFGMLNLPWPINTRLARPNAPRVFHTYDGGENQLPQDAYETQQVEFQESKWTAVLGNVGFARPDLVSRPSGKT